MPIYAYRCEACGFAKDVLQKMSDEPLTVCPECQQASFKKQVTAAGFQLKGNGWYVTDFRGGSSGSTSSTNAVSSAPASSETSSTENSSSSASTASADTSTNSSSSDSKAA